MVTRQCKRCFHRWVGRKEQTVQCPKCRSPYWDKERTNESGRLGKSYTAVRGSQKMQNDRPAQMDAEGKGVGFPVNDEIPDTVGTTAKHVLSIPGVTRGFPEPIEDEDVPEPEMCPYREYDPESGETYMCGLAVHGLKVKHTRGKAI